MVKLSKCYKHHLVAYVRLFSGHVSTIYRPNNNKDGFVLKFGELPQYVQTDWSLIGEITLYKNWIVEGLLSNCIFEINGQILNNIVILGMTHWIWQWDFASNRGYTIDWSKVLYWKWRYRSSLMISE